STDGTTWRELTNIDWALVFNTYRGSDGRIWIADHGRNGVYASSDGTDWERVGDISTSGQVSEVTRQTWGLIGYGATPPGVAVSDDGQTWRTITVAGVLGRTPGVLWVPDT